MTHFFDLKSDKLVTFRTFCEPFKVRFWPPKIIPFPPWNTWQRGSKNGENEKNVIFHWKVLKMTFFVIFCPLKLAQSRKIGSILVCPGLAQLGHPPFLPLFLPPLHVVLPTKSYKKKVIFCPRKLSSILARLGLAQLGPPPFFTPFFLTRLHVVLPTKSSRKKVTFCPRKLDLFLHLPYIIGYGNR